MSGAGMTSHNAEITNGTYQADIGTTTLKAFCNDNEGFAIYAIGFTGDQYTGEDHTKLVGASNSQKITTGTATSGATSNWAMKLNTISSPTPAYPITLDNGYGSYSSVPDAYAKVAHRDSGTDVGSTATGSQLTTTYAAYISKTQAADTYSGKVKYTLVHPKTETPAQPIDCAGGYICYYANTNLAEGTMGRQTITNGAKAFLTPSNYSRDGYGFAGWSDAYDYETNPNAHLYGPNEQITAPSDVSTNGLSFYAVWIKSAGIMQDTAKISSLCNTTGIGEHLDAAVYDDEGDADESTWSITAGLSSVSALTDIRDNQTYAIAKLSDGNCWMIENLRISNIHQAGANVVPTILTIDNTNNPLNDGSKVTLKHLYTDTVTYDTLPPTSSVTYNATTAPEGWCTSNLATCDDQARIRTDNTTSRVVYGPTETMTLGNAHFPPNVNLYSLGNYYNWYAATAGTGTYNMATNTNTSGDLCPSGWHLPTGTGTGEFGLLSNSLGGYQISGVAQEMVTGNDDPEDPEPGTTPPANTMLTRLKHFPNNYLLSGQAYREQTNSRGRIGYYWTATSSSSSKSSAFELQLFGNDKVSPGTEPYMNKYVGLSVRCVAN